jgi:hypothetical protein
MMPRRLSRLVIGAAGLAAVLAGLVAIDAAQAQGGPPPARKHRATQVQPVVLIPASEPAPGVSRHSAQLEKAARRILANAIPDHRVGPFPNRGNPHAIAEQAYDFTLPAKPAVATTLTSLHRPAGSGSGRAPNMPFGIAVNGVLFDPGTAEFWMGDRDAGWNYEALGGAVPLGLDANHAHVQPNGAYHYHGVPTLLFKSLDPAPEHHSPLIGWAADGFPIYALRGWRDPKDPSSGVKTLTSSYRLRPGERPAPPAGPGGRFDGTFIQDYTYVAGSGDLDECNGRFAVTPEYPEGTYAYFLTEDWPVIPRVFRGTPIPLRGAGARGGAGR